MRVLIADDHPLILDGFKQHITSIYPNYKIGTVKCLLELKKYLKENDTNILFQDVQFGNDDARKFVGQIKKNYPDLKIICFSTFADADIIKTLFSLGINAYVLKSENRIEISKAITAVIDNQSYISKELSNIILDNTIIHAAKKRAKLTKREEQVLKFILEEMSTKEIAENLFLASKTIENYRTSLFVKFDVTNVVGLVKKALLQGY